MVNWARAVSSQQAQLFERILNEKPHPEMGYRSCLGIIRPAQQYSRRRIEAAAERALLAARVSLHRPWHRKPVVTATRLSICGLPPCCVSWPWHELMEACVTSW
jgi:transposase